ncbi:hypothetical protein [Actinoplanes philippinensis]|nr:hypothetical protein [Actinoplanes philippinensis]
MSIERQRRPGTALPGPRSRELMGRKTPAVAGDAAAAGFEEIR